MAAPRWLAVSLVCGAVAGVASLAHAAAPPRTFYNPAPQQGDEFGFPIAAFRDRIVIAVSHDDGGVRQRGTVLLLDGTSGAQVRAFARPAVPATPAVRNGEEPLNSAVGALLTTDDRVLAGVPFDDAGREKFVGSVVIFDAQTGAVQRVVLAKAPKGKKLDRRNARFGTALCALDGQVLVGAPGLAVRSRQPAAPGPVSGAGAVFLVDPNNGNTLEVFEAPEPRENAGLGMAVATVRGMLVAGAPGATDGGAVHAFNPAGGAFIRTYRAPVPTAGDGFGAAVVGAGDLLLVGAPGDSQAGRRSGAVHVLDATSGKLLRTLKATAPEIDGSFGYALANLGDDVLVGAHGHGEGAGAVFQIHPRSGVLRETLRAPRPSPGAGFGMAVAVFRGGIAVGARREPAGEVGRGAVYVFPTEVAAVPAAPTAEGQTVP